MLDDLVGVIATLQKRIEQHRPALSQSEALTRYALIDPLLRALGWDTADPALVTPEYTVGNGRADYALLGGGDKPQAFIEAKRLDETLESPRNVEQIFTYALTQRVKYAGLTDGNRWVLDDVSDFSGSERRKLSVSLSGESAHQIALKLLLLWRPNLATGEPVAAGEPIISPPVAAVATAPAATVDSQTAISLSNQSPGEGWIPLADIQTSGNSTIGSAKGAIRLPDGKEIPIRNWWHVPREVAEYLIRTGKLTPEHCPLGEVGRSHIITAQPQLDKAGHLGRCHKLSNGCFLLKKNTGAGFVLNAKFLLQHCGVDAGAVWLKLNLLKLNL